MMTSESSFTGDEEQLKEATTVPKMINTKIDEFPGLDSVDFELVDQSDLERDITLQVCMIPHFDLATTSLGGRLFSYHPLQVQTDRDNITSKYRNETSEKLKMANQLIRQRKLYSRKRTSWITKDSQRHKTRESEDELLPIYLI